MRKKKDPVVQAIDTARAHSANGTPWVCTHAEVNELKKMLNTAYNLPYWDDDTQTFAGVPVEVSP